MKKSILLITTLVFLNACAEYTALVGPSITMAKSGSVVQTGTTFATSYGIKKTLSQSPINSLLAQTENVRECQTIHTSPLNEIFFDTLDEIDCFRDPFSILK